MPAVTRAELVSDVSFPEEPGEPLWEEKRKLPITAFYGVPAALLVGVATAVSALPLRLALLAAAAGLLVLLVRARRRSLIESYALSERFFTVVQPDGGRVAVPTASVERVTLQGDEVRIDASVGTLTLGFVRRQRALVRALESVVPALSVERDFAAFCPT